jgi:hypothetical protein
MDTFNFPNHRFSTKYPDNGIRVQFGKSYTFAAAPDSPDQRTWVLKFAGFKYYLDGAGALDVTTNASRNNLGTLEAFYKEHGTWKSFTYPHPNPAVGAVAVRFDKPLEIPDGIAGGDGMVPEFDVTLIEVP